MDRVVSHRTLYRRTPSPPILIVTYCFIMIKIFKISTVHTSVHNCHGANPIFSMNYGPVQVAADAVNRGVKWSPTVPSV